MRGSTYQLSLRNQIQCPFADMRSIFLYFSPCMFYFSHNLWPYKMYKIPRQLFILCTFKQICTDKIVGQRRRAKERFCSACTGVAAAAKKWRGLINIHNLDCTMLHAQIFECVANATRILTAAVPSIRARMRPYCAGRMPNHLRRGHVLAKKWGGHGCTCRPYAAAPAVQHCKFFNTDLSTYLLGNSRHKQFLGIQPKNSQINEGKLVMVFGYLSCSEKHIRNHLLKL